jgi:hypothetical protein
MQLSLFDQQDIFIERYNFNTKTNDLVRLTPELKAEIEKSALDFIKLFK